MTELDELQKEVWLSQLENQPRRDSDRYIVGDTDTVGAGSSLKVTFVLNVDLWAVRLHKFYCDAITGLTYIWYVDGNALELNEGEYPWGKWVRTDVILYIANPTASPGDVSYFIEGWGDLIK